MSGDTERLFISLEARISDFEKKFAAAERKGTETYQKLQRGSKSATAQMEADMTRSAGRINQALASTSSQIGAVGIALRGFAAGAVVAGITGLVGKTAEFARQIAEVGNEAKRAGVSVQAFQEWKYVAEQNRIAVDSLIDGLKELNLRADEFVVTGKGPAAEAFQRLGYTAEDLKAKLENPSELLLEIIGRLGEFDQAAQIRIADEVFGGTAGERFVELLDQGEQGIRDTIKQANDLGVVMDEKLIARADDLNRMFSNVATTVGTALKSAIVSAAASLVDFLRLWRDFDQQRTESLQGQLTDLQRQRGQLLDEKRELESNSGLSQNAIDLGFGSDGAVTQQRISDLQGRIEGLSKTEDEIIGVLQSRSDFDVPEVPESTWTPPVSPPGGFGGTSGSGGSSAGGGRGGGGRERANDLEREIAAIEKRTAALSASSEAQAGINPLLDDFGFAVERASAMQDLLTAAQEAGVAVTPELRGQIEALADAYALASAQSEQLDQSQDEVRQRAEEMAQLRRDALGGFVEDLAAGTSAADALSDALGRVGDRLLDMALDSMFLGGSGTGGGGGFLGGILGSLLSFDGGGHTGSGPRAGGIDGKGGFLAMLHPRESVIDHTRQQGQNGGSSVTLNYAPTIDARGSDPTVLPRVQAMLTAQAAEMEKQFRGRVMTAVSDPRRR